MNFRPFSNTGWNVSEIGLGCWQIGWCWCWGDLSDKTAKKILKTALDRGVNFFDTSDTYGDGRSERFLREVINVKSQKNYVTTKLGRRVRGTNYNKGYKHFAMEEFVDRSLRNLDIETIDLLQMHCPTVEDLKNPGIFDLLDNLVKKGKIQYYGISVYNLSEAVEAIKNPNIKSIQFVFNIFRQQPAEWFLQLAKEKNVALIARGPLASGLLSGELTVDTKFADNDHRSYNRTGSEFNIGDTFSGVDFEVGLTAVEKLREILPHGISLPQLALSWILSHAEINVTIPGALNSDQVNINCDSSELKLTKSDFQNIHKIYETYIKIYVHNRWQ